MASPGLEFVEAPVRVVARPASADIGGLMGTCPRGRTDKVQLVQTWAEFEALYGGFDNTNDSADLAIHYWDFIRHKGQRAYILRVVADDAAQASDTTSLLGKYADLGVTLEVHANNLGVWGDRLAVSFLRDEFTSTLKVPQTVDDNAKSLPNTASNAISRNLRQYPLESLVGVQIGDVLDIIEPTTGAHVSDSAGTIVNALVVSDIVPDENAIRFVLLGLPADVSGKLTGAPLLRTCSNHLGRTYALEQFTDGSDNILLASVEGIERGSLLTFTLASHVPSRTASGRAAYETVIVDRVVGNRVYFTAAKTLFASALPLQTAAIPAQTTAQVWMSNVDLDATAAVGSVDVQATQAGPAGNGIVFQVISGAALAVAVSGRTVSVTVNTGVTTWGNIRTAIEANAAASALITLPASAFDAMLPHNDVGVVGTLSFALEGGARLTVTTQEFQMGVTVDGVAKETTEFKNLSMVSTSRNYVEKRYGGSSNGSYLVPADNNPSNLIILVDSALVSTDPLDDLPLTLRGVALSGGLDGSAPSADDYAGAEAPRAGIWLFEEALDIAALAVPGMTDVFFQNAAIDYAERRQDLWLMLDMPSDKTTEQAMRTYREIDLGSRSTYAGLFAPHGYINDPRSVAQVGDVMVVPPSPAAMGLTLSRTRDKGAHWSAGNQQMRWLRTAFPVTPAEHTRLNEAGVSIARVLPGAGLLLYGDRTLSNFSEDGRNFGNVRRWLNYLKRSLGASLRWAPFEPANTALMARLQNVVGAFLYEEWRKGALFPDTDPSRAFQVKCDEETTTETDLAAGRVNCQVQVSPVVPAETITFNIQSSVGGVTVNET